MKSLQFCVPAAGATSIEIQNDVMDHFYPYFHRHEETQIMWIVRGQGTLVIEENLFPFQDGDIFYLGANQSHVFKSDPQQISTPSESAIHAVSIFFDLGKKLAPLFKLSEFNSLREFVSGSKIGFKVHPEYVEAIGLYIERVQVLQGMDRLFSFFGLLNELMVTSRYHSSLSVNPGMQMNISKSDQRILIAQDYILQHFTSQHLELNVVAAKASLTPQAFCRSFKKHTGLTYIAYLNHIRVQEACKLLADARLNSVSAIAFDSGFNSLTNFNRVFRQIMQCSPKEYLARYKKSLSV